MAKRKEKEDKKYNGKRSKGKGSGRRSSLRKIAKSGSGRSASGEYSKYGDVNPRDVHEGEATYRGQTTQPDTADLSGFAFKVWRGYGKEHFMYEAPGKQGLWKSVEGRYAVPVQV